MICHNCGAEYDDMSPRCPHCLTDQRQARPKPAPWLKGCSGCGCGCLVALLLLTGIVVYFLSSAWNELKKQIDTEPLITETQPLDQSQMDDLETRLAEIQRTLDTTDEKAATIELNTQELNFIIQKALAANDDVGESLKVAVDLVEDSVSTDYTFALGENRFFNGNATFFLFIDGQDVRFRFKRFKLGNFDAEQSWLQDFHSYFGDSQMRDIINDLNTTPVEQFPFILQGFSVKGEIATLVVKAKK